MHNDRTFLAIVPARGGSKRLPRKNILELCGKPMIAWSIGAAKDAECIDRVIVSTDDKGIAEISVKYGAEVPFMRPPELASDTSGTFGAIKHALRELEDEYDYVVLLQPTSPLRSAEDIDNAVKHMLDHNADCVISVCEAEHSPLWQNTLPPSLSMDGFLKKEHMKRSQDLDTYYRINGAIYIARTDRLLEEKTFFLKDRSIAYIMEQKRSVDIDNEIDFKFAEVLLCENSI